MKRIHLCDTAAQGCAPPEPSLGDLAIQISTSFPVSDLQVGLVLHALSLSQTLPCLYFYIAQKQMWKQGRTISINGSDRIQRLQNTGHIAWMLFGLRYFNSRLVSPLSRVAVEIYQLCTNIFKGLVEQRVSRTLGVAVVYGWIQLFSRRQKQPECFW